MVDIQAVPRNIPQADDRPDLTVVVPTRNEADNVVPLLSRLSACFAGPVTVIFADDSDDDTPAVIAAASGLDLPHLTVSVVHRSREERTGGLGGAVLAGLSHARTTWVCVMDGDLQHPPERVPDLLTAAVADSADLVVASRYVQGGRNEGLGAIRTVVSLASTVLAKVTFPRRLRGIHDPMSGFFLFRREALTEPMTPRGFKILLEVAVRHPGLTRCEVPFIFVEREAGTSKGTLKEGFRFLRLLAEMRWSLRAPTPGDPPSMDPASTVAA